MDAARWQKIEALFHQARELSDEDARELLDGLRGRDADLVERVETMLDAHRQSSARLGGIVHEAVLGALEQLPESIGPYEVVSRIGTGGFSSVYLARLNGDPAQQVAVKVLRRGYATEDSVGRLRQEAEILARLHHPNIARLLDYGTGNDTGNGATDRFGEPYFVMEWVEGEPIDRFCDRRRLTVDERLKLFRQACSAVDYAHRNLIIHRDIKPSNLLVTRDGVPKLLDFGIAKLMEPQVSRVEPVQTAAGGSLMTPEFASPEQVREEPLTTATDVYSLGVLLYRLLCGRPPYRFVARSQRDIEEVITTTEPALPSDALSRETLTAAGEGEADSPEQIAERRQTQPGHLRTRLRGDLDSIVLTALSKEPEERYSSALQLSRDIGLHLSSLPVTARRITTGYRLRKFIRRHRLAVSVSAVLITTLLTAVVVTTRATYRAESERARAERHLAESRQVTEFLVDIFEVPDPEIAQGREISARRLLDEGARRIDQLDLQPEVQASLMVTMGRVYRGLGDHRRSRELLAEALEQRRFNRPDSDPAVIESLQQLARSLMVQGDFEAASDLLHQAQSALEAGDQETAAAYGQILNLKAEVSQELSRLDEAETLYRRALDLQTSLLAPDDPDLIDTLGSLGELAALRRDFKSAEEMFRKTLELRRSRLGENHPDVAATLSNLSMVLYNQSRMEEAETMSREAVRIRARLYGEEHWIVGKSYNNLAQTLAAQGKTSEALPWLEKALEIGRAQLGADHPQIASRLVNLGRLYARLERTDEAEHLYREGLEVHRRSLGDEHPSTARNLYRLAELYADSGRDTEALDLLQQALLGLRKALPADDYRLSHPLLLQGKILVRRGQCARALESLGTALRLRRQNHPDDHPRVAAVLAEQERCLTNGLTRPPKD